MKFKIQLLNSIAEAGINKFNPQFFELSEKGVEPDALLLRSFNLHESAIPASIKVVGRAGVGVNNIPLKKLTQLGIPVLNTPGANANAVKELVITGLLLACRNICAAWHYTRQLNMDDSSLNETIEKNKKQFSGIELPGKTLGVIGLGNVGVQVANIALQLGMKVIGYDPAITVKQAWQLSSAVQHAQHLNELLPICDFITLHVPLLESTHHLINAHRLKLMKQNAIILNFAREKIVDNNALLKALNEKHIQTYVCDFPTIIFNDHPQIICLPHLGASTKEAEENCAIMIAEAIQAFLQYGHIKNSVNFPEVNMPLNKAFRIAITNENVPNIIAQISTILSNAQFNIIDMINKSKENIAYTLLDVNQPFTAAIVKEIQGVKGILNARVIN